MASNSSSAPIDIREYQYRKLRDLARQALMDPRVPLAEKERAMDRAIDFQRRIIQSNKAAGLYDYEEKARFFKDGK